MDYKSIIMAQAFGGDGGGATVERFVFEGTPEHLYIRTGDIERFNELFLKYLGTDNVFANCLMDASSLGFGTQNIACDMKSLAESKEIALSTVNVTSSISGIVGASIVLHYLIGYFSVYGSKESDGDAIIIANGEVTRISGMDLPMTLTCTFIVD
jgi:hypothetical protein